MEKTDKSGTFGGTGQQVRRDQTEAPLSHAHVIKSPRPVGYSIVASRLLIVYELFTKIARKWHDSFVVTSRDTMEKIIEHFKILAAPWHALFHLICIPAHTVTSSSLIGTPSYVPWRKPFFVPVSGAL